MQHLPQETPKVSISIEQSAAWTRHDGAWTRQSATWTENDAAWMQHDGAWMRDGGAWTQENGAWTRHRPAWTRCDDEEMRRPAPATPTPVVRPYWLVANFDAAYAEAVQSGGQPALPPTELPGHGRCAIYFRGGIEHGLWQK